MEYSSRSFLDLGIVKHIFGLFLVFSDAGLCAKSKQEILRDSKLYIDDLKNKNQLEHSAQFVSLPTAIGHMFGSYLSLGFQGKDFEEFKEFSTYITEVQESERIEKIPTAAQDLLETMQHDVWKFHRMICPDSSYSQDVSEPKYYEIPILKYISPTAFLEKLLLMRREDQRCVFWAIKERYKYDNSSEKLLEELGWLKSVQILLLEEINHRKGKVSSLCFQLLDTHYLSEVIEKLETKS